MSKPLYILVTDGGDGSYSTSFTLDSELIQRLEAAAEKGLMEHPHAGYDGDGFHYDTIQVPDDATYESLDISFVLSDDAADKFDNL
jgi:hypothetical protein